MGCRMWSDWDVLEIHLSFGPVKSSYFSVRKRIHTTEIVANENESFFQPPNLGYFIGSAAYK